MIFLQKLEMERIEERGYWEENDRICGASESSFDWLADKYRIIQKKNQKVLTTCMKQMKKSVLLLKVRYRLIL